jgi:hypothetical protein
MMLLIVSFLLPRLFAVEGWPWLVSAGRQFGSCIGDEMGLRIKFRNSLVPSPALPNGDTTPAVKPGLRPVPRLRNSNHRTLPLGAYSGLDVYAVDSRQTPQQRPKPLRRTTCPRCRIYGHVIRLPRF